MMVLSASQSRAAEFNKGLQHCRQIESRTADNLEHFGGRGLLLQEFAQFVKQAGILDGNDGLVAKL